MSKETKPIASFFISERSPYVRKISFGIRGGKWKPLHHVPATHRIVPVELLERVMVFPGSEDEALLQAIINKEPI